MPRAATPAAAARHRPARRSAPATPAAAAPAPIPAPRRVDVAERANMNTCSPRVKVVPFAEINMRDGARDALLGYLYQFIGVASLKAIS
jgi:hypothetical protein